MVAGFLWPHIVLSRPSDHVKHDESYHAVAPQDKIQLAVGRLPRELREALVVCGMDDAGLMVLTLVFGEGGSAADGEGVFFSTYVNSSHSACHPIDTCTVTTGFTSIPWTLDVGSAPSGAVAGGCSGGQGASLAGSMTISKIDAFLSLQYFYDDRRDDHKTFSIDFWNLPEVRRMLRAFRVRASRPRREFLIDWQCQSRIPPSSVRFKASVSLWTSLLLSRVPPCLYL